MSSKEPLYLCRFQDCENYIKSTFKCSEFTNISACPLAVAMGYVVLLSTEPENDEE